MSHHIFLSHNHQHSTSMSTADFNATFTHIFAQNSIEYFTSRARAALTAFQRLKSSEDIDQQSMQLEHFNVGVAFELVSREYNDGRSGTYSLYTVGVCTLHR